MVKKKQIGKDGYSESPNCEVHDRRWSSALSAKSCAALLAESLFLPSINDLSNKTRCTVLANFTSENSIFLFNPLSELTSLNPVKTVSTFAAASGKLEGGNQKVSI
jgi:hypothetical protein